MGDQTQIWIASDPSIDRLSALINPSPQLGGFATTFFFKAAGIATDLTVIESSLLTLGIADAVLPACPGVSKHLRRSSDLRA